MNALPARDIDTAFASAVETLAAHRDGRSRIIAVTTPWRIPTLPDVPATTEFAPGCVAPNRLAMAGPPGLPAPILARLSAELTPLGQDAEFRARPTQPGVVPVLPPPAVLATRLAEDIPAWRRIAAEAGIRAE